MFPLVLFDGDCHFCARSVQFIIKHDREETFYFAPLQSRLAQRLLKKHQLPQDLTSLVLIEKEQAFMKAAAVLKISRQLHGFWKLFYIFKLVPKPILNFIYDTIARNRYKWFGMKSACKLYPEHIRKRFLTE